MQWVYKYSSVCAARTGQFRWPEDCHSYVDCWRGRGTLKRCHPPSLVFNEDTAQCDWPRSATNIFPPREIFLTVYYLWRVDAVNLSTECQSLFKSDLNVSGLGAERVLNRCLHVI